MTQYVGLDVSMRETKRHVLDDAGKRVWRDRCATEPAAIAAAVRRYAPTAVRIGLETGPLTTWLWTALTADRRLGVARQADRHQIEFFVTTLLRICRELTELDLTPLKIRLVHHRAKLPMEFTNLFGPDVRFNCPIDDVTYPRSAADAPVTKADPYLNSLLVQYFDEALANRPHRSTAWRLKVENAIASCLPHGRPQIEEISKRLGVSPRTLARRLALEGTNFTKLFETLRCDLAKRYLQEDDLPIAEVAWLLGYQEPSAFNHAFKRWTSTTPKQARTVSDLSLA